MQDTPLRKRHFCDLFPLISSVYLQLSRGPNKLVRILCLSHFIEAQARFKFFLFFFCFLSFLLIFSNKNTCACHYLLESHKVGLQQAAEKVSTD